MTEPQEVIQPEGAFEFCDFSLGAYWRSGWEWTRRTLRGAALGDDDLTAQLEDKRDILYAPFHRGWLVETVEHDGEWSDPQWPIYTFQTTEPDGGTSMKVSWLELA